MFSIRSESRAQGCSLAVVFAAFVALGETATALAAADCADGMEADLPRIAAMIEEAIVRGRGKPLCVESLQVRDNCSSKWIKFAEIGMTNVLGRSTMACMFGLVGCGYSWRVAALMEGPLYKVTSLPVSLPLTAILQCVGVWMGCFVGCDRLHWSDRSSILNAPCQSE